MFTTVEEEPSPGEAVVSRAPKTWTPGHARFVSSPMGEAETPRARMSAAVVLSILLSMNVILSVPKQHRQSLREKQRENLNIKSRMKSHRPYEQDIDG